MKVILLQDIEDVGKKYEVKEVKDGHARNFLIPQNMVKPATKENLHWLKSQRDQMEQVAEEDLKKAQELASHLDGLEVAIGVKVGESGELFESISSAKITDRLKEMGFEVKKSHIKLDKPIKEIGEFPVKINLDHNLETEIKVIVSEAAPEEAA